jgi:lactate dehydrogenase-like 2-hydroxyacid dehydrogenase
VDEVALTAALQNGKILGAGLDTFAKEPTDPANPLLRSFVLPILYSGKRSFISGMTQSGGWPAATRWTLA